ncbi:enoyl-CoA hydratase [Streptomyces sp. PRh5]|uniref:enoyl-CoA hydratase n=1 Tax=Streptomyces sp. PRh5 TaxID=1158056 RepID=UPI000449A39A|nr:enoyl-CoA hydratase [Streptomyces sp. PRh5]EXU62040.1 enoyl-CoA hydratase [Streptomyces sp. PRh5]
MTSTLVLLESDGPLRTIRLNAPERRNALDLDLLAQLATAIATVKADADARALIVAGAGKSFCAGANLESMFGDITRPVHELREHLKSVYASFLGLRDLAIPTLAAVQGAAVGAGLNIALACDIVVAGPHAAFGPTFADIGLHPGGGCSFMLTERMGSAHAVAALLSGDVIKAVDAVRLGLANLLAEDPEAKATEMASRYASRTKELNANIKRSVRIAATSDLETSIDFESWAQASSVGGDDFRRYLQEFLRD